ncbi:MAG: SMC-Scp complex subunit ScpB [Tissierellia bacterium]|nr:SMC-Scp complex subunit ScpB [Tissierellia bacterium]
MELKEIKAKVEAILFAYGEKLNIAELADILEISNETIYEVLYEMVEDYKDESRGIELKIFGDSCRLSTKEMAFDVLKKLSNIKFPKALSDSSMEVLSIIAYKQPITKIEVDTIRGVKSDRTIANLLEKDLIKESGKLDVIGNPALYRTTEEFLRVFNLNHIGELPTLSFVQDSEISFLIDSMEDDSD